jgi:dTDP-4-dehydrorhamnose reductase
MRIILFGANGMLGHYFSSWLSQFYEMILITREQYDVVKSNMADLDSLISKDINVIINCIGLIPQRGINEDYIRINSEFPHLLNAIAQKYTIPFIHITTDCVFDGQKGNYNENDQHTEKGIYGYSKSLGEPHTATIIRTSIIGEEKQNKKSLLEWVKSQNGKTINGFTNHYWNGVTCLQLAKIVDQIISEKLYWQGVRHIFSPSHISKFQLVEMIRDIYGLDIEIIAISANFSDKTLCSIYPIVFDIPDLQQQIQEQKSF